ncbi:MAG: hypothetical protein ACJA08_000466 [Cyclobacteriaceae bacterium]|jgi:hypothetical protein
MKKWLFIFPIILLCKCATVKVIHFVNEDASFKSYTNFSVVNYKTQGVDISAEGSLLFNEIETNIENQMFRREYQKSNLNPDIIVRYEIISNQVSETRTVSPYANPYSGFGPSFSTRTFLESALLIELTDISTRKMVWQGSVDLSKYDQGNEQNKLLKKAISQIFDTYLYHSGSDVPDPTLIENK